MPVDVGGRAGGLGLGISFIFLYFYKLSEFRASYHLIHKMSQITIFYDDY